MDVEEAALLDELGLPTEGVDEAVEAADGERARDDFARQRRVEAVCLCEAIQSDSSD